MHGEVFIWFYTFVNGRPYVGGYIYLLGVSNDEPAKHETESL